jgi:hypothetical protein
MLRRVKTTPALIAINPEPRGGGAQILLLNHDANKLKYYAPCSDSSSGPVSTKHR